MHETIMIGKLVRHCYLAGYYMIQDYWCCGNVFLSPRSFNFICIVDGSYCWWFLREFVLVFVRPGAAGLLIGIECSRVSDNSWMYLISFVTTRVGIELDAVQRKLPDCVVVALQLYSAMIFHVILPPGYIRAGRDPLKTSSTPKTIQTTTHDVGYYATRGPNLSKSLCSL